jgi:hypothetical protein
MRMIRPHVKEFEVPVPSRLLRVKLNRGRGVIRENTRVVKMNMGLLRQREPERIGQDPIKFAPNMTIRPGEEAASGI